MSGDLLGFLADRLAEDEELARQARDQGDAPTWDSASDAFLIEGLRTRRRLADRGVSGALAGAAEVHSGRHDAARVLAEVAAKRRTLARHSAAPGGEELAMPLYCAAHAFRHRDGTVTYPIQLDNCPDLRDLALPYAGHPAYQEAWRP